MANNVTATAWADHLRGCVDLSKEIAERMGIHSDESRQSCFATVVIGADRHNIFLAPTPAHTKSPVKPELGGEEGKPDTAAANSGDSKKIDHEQAAAIQDEEAARKADAQVADIIPNPTAETADSAKRTALLRGINSARDLLNKAGHVPPVTPKGLNAYIANQFKDPPRTELGQLDTDELERLTMLLSSKLDVLREKKSKDQEAF